MIRQTLVELVADEPADRDIDLRFPHQPTVMHNAEQQPGEHQPDRDLRIDAGPTVVHAVAVRHRLTLFGVKYSCRSTSTILAGSERLLIDGE